jgi:hypothetical protein
MAPSPDRPESASPTTIVSEPQMLDLNANLRRTDEPNLNATRKLVAELHESDIASHSKFVSFLELRILNPTAAEVGQHANGPFATPGSTSWLYYFRWPGVLL